MKIARFMLRFALVLLFAGRAAAFSYDEGVSGDLDNFNDPPIFNFDLGANSVSGSTGFGEFGAADADIFGFTLPTVAQLQSVLLNYQITSVVGDVFLIQVLSQIAVFADDGTWTSGDSLISFASTAIHSAGGQYPPVEPSPVALNLLDVVDSNVVLNSPTLPLVGGPYVFAPGWGGLSLGNPTATWSYTYSFSVVPIPEPGVAVILGVGLAGLSLRRPRQMS